MRTSSVAMKASPAPKVSTGVTGTAGRSMIQEDPVQARCDPLKIGLVPTVGAVPRKHLRVPADLAQLSLEEGVDAAVDDVETFEIGEVARVEKQGTPSAWVLVEEPPLTIDDGDPRPRRGLFADLTPGHVDPLDC